MIYNCRMNYNLTYSTLTMPALRTHTHTLLFVLLLFHVVCWLSSEIYYNPSFQWPDKYCIRKQNSKDILTSNRRHCASENTTKQHHPSKISILRNAATLSCKVPENWFLGDQIITQWSYDKVLFILLLRY